MSSFDWGVLSRIRGRVGSGDDCSCEATFREPAGTGVADRVVLAVDAADCPGRGDLASEPACRGTVVRALSDRDADVVRVRRRGWEATYADRAAALLVAAGRFRERVAVHEPRLADRAATDPLGAAREATGRAGPVSRIAATVGLAELAAAADGYGDALRPYTGPSIGAARVASGLPAGATLTDRWESDTGATIRIYDGDGPLRTYHLTPPTANLDPEAFAALAAARDRLLTGESGGDRAAGRAIRAVVDDVTDLSIGSLTSVLDRHTRGHGVLEHVFADDRVTDAFLTPPVAETPLRVAVDGERLTTNVRVPPEGAATLASRLRRASGDGFSRASPVLDATIDTSGGPVRVAATTEPAADGLGFTFRCGADDPWTLPRLVAADTLTVEAAGLLSLAVDRGVAALVAGGRGAGKTTTLGALLWELSPGTRLVVVEDTPELPAPTLREQGRDVQRLYTDPGGGAAPSPAEAVRTALRLGDGALVVGEVRGEEAAALYEAMRVGAGGDTVLGTVHGADGPAVRERVVTDLGVPESSFADTDVIVTLTDRAVTSVSEVCKGHEGVGFAPLFERDGSGLTTTGRIERGNSTLVADLAGPDGSYADVREAIGNRTRSIRRLVDHDRIGAPDVAAAVTNR